MKKFKESFAKRMKLVLFTIIAMFAVTAISAAIDTGNYEVVTVLATAPIVFAFTTKSTFEDYLSKQHNLTKDAFGKLEAEKQSEIYAEFESGMQKAIADAIENKADKDAIDSLKTELKNAQNEAVETLKKALFEQGKTLKKLMEDGQKIALSGNKSDAAIKEIKENMSTIKAILVDQTQKEITLKAISNRASIDGNQQAVELPDIGQLATRRLSMYDLFPKIPVGTGNHNGTVRYYDWDEDTTIRAAAMVAEGGVFPESTAKFKTYVESLKKIGDSLPVTEEFFEDAVMFYAELQLFLDVNVRLVEDFQIAKGNGTGQQLKGLLNRALTYTPVASGISDASLYDLIVKMREGITALYGGKYQPDTVIANANTINKMKLKKDKNENYVLPPFVDRSGNIVDGMVVVESNVFDNGEIVVCDRRFGRIYEMPGITITRGEIDGQFIEDAYTLKARKRLLFLIREVDRTGFLKVTDIDAALTVLATDPT